MRYFFFLISLLMLSGCNEGGTNTRPYISGTQHKQAPVQNAQYGVRRDSDKVAAAKIIAESEQELARINMEKEVLLQKLKSVTEVEKAHLNKEIALKQVEADKHKALITKEIAVTQEQTQRQIALNANDLQKWVLLVVAFFLLAVVIFVFYNTNRNRKERLKMHQDNLDQTLRIKEQEMRVKIAEHLIDAMASGKLSAEQENKLLGAYSGTNSSAQLPYHSQDQAQEEASPLLEENSTVSEANVLKSDEAEDDVPEETPAK